MKSTESLIFNGSVYLVENLTFPEEIIGFGGARETKNSIGNPQDP